MTMSDSDSPLSSPPESEDERPVKINLKTKQPKKKAPMVQTKIKLKPPVRSPSPQPKKRKKEPPREPQFADRPELAFLVMFRSRFADAFKGVPNFGPQDLERGLQETTASEQVEQLLCRLISLVLNRKKPVERGHHNRALEEVLTAQKQQWPRQWEGRNPLPGTRTFNDLDPSEKLVLLKALANWALTSSEQIRTIIAENYKGSRREDDLNVAISVQPWGRDGDKRRYWLIEGRDDTTFRLYRESNPALKTTQWISIAESIDELKAVAADLEEYDGTKHAITLKDKILSAIPRFEEGEVRRRKREYRQSRKAFFNQIPGVSLYEGRTRGKRIRYTFSDDEGAKETPAPAAENTGTRRSARSHGTVTPATEPEPEPPRFTASGRMIRKPNLGEYGELKTDSGRTAVEYVGGENGVAQDPMNPYGNGTANGGGDASWNGDSEGDDEFSDTDEYGNKKSLRIVLKVKQQPAATVEGKAEEEKPQNGMQEGKQEEEKQEEGKQEGDITMLDIGPLEKRAPAPAADVQEPVSKEVQMTNGDAPAAAQET